MLYIILFIAASLTSTALLLLILRLSGMNHVERTSQRLNLHNVSDDWFINN